MKTALIVLDLISGIVDPNGKLGQLSAARRIARYHGQDEWCAGDPAPQGLGRGARESWLFRQNIRSNGSTRRSSVERTNTTSELGQWGTEFHSDLLTLVTDFLFTKTRVSAFYNTSLESYYVRKRSNARCCLA